MVIDYSILNEFAELVTPEKESKPDNLYGTVKIQNGNTYVQIDGSTELTPISTVAMVSDGDRVTVTIANHIATITGNLTDPSASSVTVKETSAKIDEFGTVVADVVQTTNLTTQNLDAAVARIGTLEADNVTINGALSAHSADISNLTSDKANITDLTAATARIDTLESNAITTEYLNANYATVDNLKATNANVYNLQTDYATVNGKLTAQEASINDLSANKLDATSADLRYANIDFSNITMTSVQELFAKSGIIDNLVVGDTSITGELVGVTIKGDLIEGGTVVADKLVVKGTDGLYYKLNTDGVTTEAEQTDYNSLNGSIITANSITASKINVDDLVAFNATIGGMQLTDGSIYSGAKASVDNTTNGFYMDKDGQLAVGNASNYLKFYKQTDGTYKLEISASSIKFGASGTSVETAINNTISTANSASEAVADLEARADSGEFKGADGTSYYTHIKYSANSDGSSFVSTPTSSTKYIGIYNGTSKTAPTSASSYTWSKYVGEDGQTGATGNGVSSITSYYLTTTTQTQPSESSFTSTTIPTMSETNKYLWRMEIITYTTSTTPTKIISLVAVYGDKGEQGETGATGKSIGTITNYYLATSSSSGVTTSTTGWTTDIQSMTTTKKYLWNYEVIKYSDGTTANTSTPCIIGVYGETGQTGGTGATGNGISSITEYYQLGTSGTTAPSGDWVTTVPTLTATNKYLWNYEKIKYTNNSEVDTTKRVIGVYGDTGNTGKGVSSIVTQYYLSSSNTTQTGGSWGADIPSYIEGYYYWTRDYITWTDNSTSYSTPALANGITDSNSSLLELGNTVTSLESQIKELQYSSEIIVGTQTSSTGSWTGVAGFSELKNGQQIYYLLPYAGSGSATLNLTLSDGSTTGAINCYYGSTTRLTTHYPQGSTIHLTYYTANQIGSSTYEGWWADPNYNTNDYDRLVVTQPVYAGETIPTYRLCGSLNNKYYIIEANEGFEITQPILWCASQISSGGSGSWKLYFSYPSCNLQYNLSGFTGTSNTTCYLVGTLEGNIFTPTDTFFTTTIPTTEDGLVYLALGLMISTTNIILYPEHPMYMFIDGEFKNLNQVAYNAYTNAEIIGDELTTTKTEYETRFETTNTAISSVAESTQTSINSLTGQITSINTSMLAVTQTAERVELNFNTYKATQDTLNSGVQTELENYSKYIRFIDGNIVLGEEGNTLTLKLTHDSIVFIQTNEGETVGQEVASWKISDGSFTSELKLGNFAFIPRDSGNLSFKKVK